MMMKDLPDMCPALQMTLVRIAVLAPCSCTVTQLHVLPQLMIGFKVCYAATCLTSQSCTHKPYLQQ